MHTHTDTVKEKSSVQTILEIQKTTIISENRAIIDR